MYWSGLVVPREDRAHSISCDSRGNWAGFKKVLGLTSERDLVFSSMSFLALQSSGKWLDSQTYFRMPGGDTWNHRNLGLEGTLKITDPTTDLCSIFLLYFLASTWTVTGNFQVPERAHLIFKILETALTIGKLFFILSQRFSGLKFFPLVSLRALLAPCETNPGSV